jgi:5'-nucleotidase
MSAALDPSIEGIPAIGFSLLDYRWEANFDSLRNYIEKITRTALKEGIPKGNALNVNFPKLKEKEIKGIKICRQAKAYWIEKFDKRTNPQGQEYYWLTGKFVDKDKGEDTDEWVLNNGFISIVPVEFDLTAHFAIKDLNEWDFK